MAAHWNIPRTHYDFAKDRDSALFVAIEKDIEHIETLGLRGPFGSPDDCSTAFEEYLDNRVQAIKQDVRHRAEDFLGNQLNDQEFDTIFRQMPDYASLLYGTLSEYLSCLNFELFNKKVFYITDNLVSQLAITELDAPSEYVRLPFPSCMFVLTSDIAAHAMYQIGGNAPPSTRAPVTFFLNELPYEGVRKLLIVAYHSKGGRTFNLIKRELLIRPDWGIERTLHTDWNKLYDENGEWIDSELPSVGEVFGYGGDESIFYQDGLTFFRIIVNAVLYLASSDPDIICAISPALDLERRLAETQSRPKRKKIKNELSKISGLDGSIVGGNVRHILVDRRTHASTTPEQGSSKIEKRFLVRGHWRNQACGEGRKERKLIFIAPYFKGPEMSDLVDRTYVVK